MYPFRSIHAYELKVLLGQAPSELMFVAMRMFKMEMVPAPDYVAWRRDKSAFLQLAGMQFHGGNAALLGDREPVEVRVTRVSANFLTTLGIEPALGRNFEEREELPNAPPTALLTDGLWRKHFQARRDVVGQNIVLDGFGYQVVGVLPPSFMLPFEVPTDILTTLPISPTVSHHDRGLAIWTVIGRLRPGVTQGQALARVKTLFAASTADAPEIFRDDVSVMVEPLQQRMAGNARTLVVVLVSAVVCLLLIACANVANLVLSRWSVRSSELAVRAAIGAGRGRLVRQLLTETAVLSGTGLIVGLALIYASLHGVVFYAVGSLPRLNELKADGRVFGIALAVSLLTMLLFGVLPALRAARVDVQSVMANASRPGLGGGYRHVRRTLVAGEVALSVVLLAGAALMLETLWRMQNDHLGFAPENVMSVSIPLRGARKAKRKALTEEILADIQRVPGTIAASWSECTPLTTGSYTTSFTRSDRPLPKPWDRVESVAGCAIGTDYFQASGIRLIRGRAFVGTDFDHPQTFAIINEALAGRFFPGEDPIGRQIDGHSNGDVPRNDGWKTVIGVVADSKNQGLTLPAAAQMFVNDFALFVGSDMTFVVRYAGDERLFTNAVRGVLRQKEPELLAKFETLDEAIGHLSAGSRFNGVLVASFAVVAFLMAVIGVYGVLALAVVQRTQEIGIRVALGAGPRAVEGLILKEGVLLMVIGTVLGLGVSLLAGRYLKTLLYDVSATDLPTYLAVVVGIGITAIVAAWIPARRAASLDPTVALRCS